MHSPKLCPHFMVFVLMILYVFIFLYLFLFVEPLMSHLPMSHLVPTKEKPTQDFFLVSWHLQIWTCVFAAVAKGRESAAKGSRKV